MQQSNNSTSNPQESQTSFSSPSCLYFSTSLTFCPSNCSSLALNFCLTSSALTSTDSCVWAYRHLPSSACLVPRPSVFLLSSLVLLFPFSVGLPFPGLRPLVFSGKEKSCYSYVILLLLLMTKCVERARFV